MTNCIFCGKEISSNSKQCKSCSNRNRPKIICSKSTREKISNANLGRVTWNKGLTKETDERVRKYGKSGSKSKKGKPNGQKGKHYINKSLSQIGKKNPVWKGGVTPKNKLIRDSIKYSKWRKSVFQRDNYTCQKCLDSSGGNLIAHHILNFFSHPNLRFNVKNGRTLCNKCHNKFHKKYGYYNNTKEQIIEFLDMSNRMIKNIRKLRRLKLK